MAIAAALALAAVLAVLHYVLAAVAVRAASGVELPLKESTLVQFAAAALNRVAPAGLGAAAANVRYLSRRGLPPGAAVSAMAVLGLLGALGDACAAGLLLGAAPWAGLGGGLDEVHTLSGQGMSVVTYQRLPAAVAVLAAIALSLLVFWALGRARRHGAVSALDTHRGHAWDYVTTVVRQPARGTVSLVASAGTTLVLAVAFAVVVRAFAGADAPPVACLLVAYLVGAAAGSALPIPAVVGPTEAALTAALVASGVAGGDALFSVLLFRGVTFWAPVPVGLLALRRLRGRAAL